MMVHDGHQMWWYPWMNPSRITCLRGIGISSILATRQIGVNLFPHPCAKVIHEWVVMMIFICTWARTNHLTTRSVNIPTVRLGWIFMVCEQQGCRGPNWPNRNIPQYENSGTGVMALSRQGNVDQRSSDESSKAPRLRSKSRAWTHLLTRMSGCVPPT